MFKLSELSLYCPYCGLDNMGNLGLMAIKKHKDSTEIKCSACGRSFGAKLHFSPYLITFGPSPEPVKDQDLFIDNSTFWETT